MFKTIEAADFSAFGAPVQKLIELNTTTMNKVFDLQKAAIEKQMAQSHTDFKSVMEIKDIKALTAFVTEKSEEATAKFEALKADIELAAESTKAYFAEVQAILNESKDAVVKAAPSTKKTAKKAA